MKGTTEQRSKARHLLLLCSIVPWWLLSVTIGVAAEPELLATGLDAPTAVCVAPGPAGGVRLVVAEAGRLSELIVLGESILNRKPLVELSDQAVTGIAWCEGRFLLAGPDGLGGYDAAGGLRPPVGAPLEGAAVLGEHWLYSRGAGQLVRHRLAGGRVARGRPVGPEGYAPRAIAQSPAGYLAVVAESEGARRLLFCDPGAPDPPLAVYPITTKTPLRAIAYAGEDLFALGEAGLYRLVIDATPQRLAVRAVLEAEIAEPVALTTGPEGEVYAVSREGALFRFRPTQP